MEEKKTYDFKGTVTISTEEYRDLIQDCVTFKREFEDYRSKWWEEQRKVNDLEKKQKELTAELDRLRAFIDSKKDILLAFKLYSAGIEEATDA